MFQNDLSQHDYTMSQVRCQRPTGWAAYLDPEESTADRRTVAASAVAANAATDAVSPVAAPVEGW